MRQGSPSEVQDVAYPGVDISRATDCGNLSLTWSAFVILDVHLMAGFANRMIQYMVARRIAAEVGGCLISNAALSAWGIDHPKLPGFPGPEIEIPVSPQKVDIAWITHLLLSGERTRVNLKSYAQWFPNFPALDLCREMFKANEDEYPGFGPEYLVCNVRGGNILDGKKHPDYTLLPIEFYADVLDATGLRPVFMGQIEENAYCNALRRRFPGAAFYPSRGALADFQTFRNSKNLVTAVSSFSWLAAWLSRAELIVLPVNGLFHPVQSSDIDLLPYADERYRFYLFPINYAVAVEHFEEAHQALHSGWRYMRPETIRQLRSSMPRCPKRLDRFLLMFDEKFYLENHLDVAYEVEAGGTVSGLDHYVRHGFNEGRHCFALDDRWYSTEYPMAAFEVGQGDYVNFSQHFVEVGAMRGYKPLRPNRHG
jgi:hypothetical protein